VTREREPEVATTADVAHIHSPPASSCLAAGAPVEALFEMHFGFALQCVRIDSSSAQQLEGEAVAARRD